jgi:hypothetical protein
MVAFLGAFVRVVSAIDGAAPATYSNLTLLAQQFFKPNVQAHLDAQRAPTDGPR